MVELGETVGILAAQSIGEPGTQLTMRTFHTGGIFSSETAKMILAPTEGIINYNTKNGGKKINTKYKEKVFFTTTEKEIKIYTGKVKKYKIKLPKNSIIFIKPNKKIFNKQAIAEITELNKEKNYKKIKEKKEIKTSMTGLTYIEKIKEKKNIIWVLSSNKSPLNKYKKKLVKKDALYENRKKEFPFLTLVLNNKNLIKKGTNRKNKSTSFSYLIQKKLKKEISVKKLRTEQIIRINSIKNYIQINNFMLQDKIFKTKILSNEWSFQVIQVREKQLIIRKSKPYPLKASNSQREYNLYTQSVKKNTTLFSINYGKQKTEDIVQGLPKVEELLEAKKTIDLEKIKNGPHEKLIKYFSKVDKKYENNIAVKKSIDKIQDHLLAKVQEVYESQGVKIADKHVEIIIKQMTTKVIVINKGDSNFLVGEIINLEKAERVSKKLNKNFRYQPLILGISKLALNCESFIAEASFQETTKTLTKSAIEGRVDWLYGLKENIILGNLIPAGTGK
jgi:hypothetical protein